MKKNLIKKLALSAVTMGVAAVTVTTTTYAWFTANQSATATGINADVTAADEGNLMVSKTGTAGSWGPSISFGTSGVTMMPVQRTATGYKTLDGENDTTGVFLTYTVYFNVSDLPSQGGELYMSLGDMAFSQSKSMTLLQDAGTDPSAKNGQQVTVSLADVLNMQVKKVADVTGVGYTENTYRYLAETNANAVGPDALTYYNNVMHLETPLERPTSNYTFGATALYTPAANEASATYNEIKLADVSSSTATFGMTFTFFIDGWDAQCFNAIGGQGITAGQFNFRLAKKTANNG